MTKRVTRYILIKRVGTSWTGYRGFISGRGREVYWTGGSDIDEVLARMRATFPDDEVRMPSAAIIAEGLPPDLWDATDAVVEWLEANPTLNPSLLAMVKVAQAAELEH